MNISPSLLSALSQLSLDRDRASRTSRIAQILEEQGGAAIALAFWLKAGHFETGDPEELLISLDSPLVETAQANRRRFSLTTETRELVEQLKGLQMRLRIPRPRKIVGLFSLCGRSAVDAFVIAILPSRPSVDVQRTYAALGDLIQVIHASAESLQRAEREAADAAAVQQSYLPIHLPHIPALDYQCFVRPAAAVGGDYFDVRFEKDGLAVFVVGDVVGKGPAAALVMSCIISHLRREISTKLERITELVAALNWIAFSAAKRYTSLFFLVIDTVNLSFKYVSAGHQPPAIFAKSDGRTLFLTEGGPPLGLTETPLGDYSVGVGQVSRGDLLVIATDGVTDAEDAKGNYFGIDRLMEAIVQHDQRASPQVFVASLIHQLEEFIDSNEQTDDVTVVAIKIT